MPRSGRPPRSSPPRDNQAGGPGATLATLTRGYEVFGNESIDLERLGITSREFNGRLLRTRLELRFPPISSPPTTAR
ncbi:hypothetical protein MMB17_04785 [Methylobacterium organophilum]|uniref:hypothetical protein n=1 Tax=Methylobacterium organophilum TaxID=410 RepID=UPI001F132AE4|nr:hypothetical protein [Methylobacterium organophilum]UMY18648.1 hypothetical protein MMB17_04785 [Methylobacterium organophilum]